MGFEESIQRFHEMLAKQCSGVPDDENCKGCWLRLYCFAGPRSITKELIHDVIKFLESDQAIQESEQ